MKRPVDMKRIIETANAAKAGTARVIDGPLLYSFDPRKLAEAIELEAARCKAMGWPKLDLHMDVADALRLARFLKSGGRQ